MLNSARQISLPRFDVDLKQLAQILIKTIEESRDELAKILTSQHSLTWQTLMIPLEDIQDRIHQQWAMLEHLHKCNNSNKDVRAAYEKALPIYNGFKIELKQSEQLYKAIKNISVSKEFATYSPTQKALVHYYLQESKLFGIELSLENRQRLADLQKKLAELNNQFGTNVGDAIQSWEYHTEDSDVLRGLSAMTLQQAAEKAANKGKKGWILTLDQACYFQVMESLENRMLRAEMYEAYFTVATKGKTNNSPIMEDILKTRHEIAKLLGFANHAAFSTFKKMAGTPQAVLKQVHEVIKSAKPIAMEEMAEVREFALKMDGINDLQSWDVAFYSKKILQKKHDINNEELRSYFPLSKVIRGLFEVLNKLYGISILPNEKAPKWDPLVLCFDVLDENKALRGTFYMDLFSRAGKTTGPGYAFSLRQRCELADGTIQHPIAVVSCNLNPPTEKQPALVSPEEVQVNVFHEVGHCLQLVLTQVNGVLSTFESLPWDAVELPSHYLEYWAKEKDVYPLISAHYETNEPLPQKLINKLNDARNFQSGLDWINYLENVLFDLSLHMQYDPNKPSQIQAIMNEVRQQISVLPKPECNRFQNRFTHAFAGYYNDSYSAGYYVYLWSDVLAADAFSQFEAKDIFDRKNGKLFQQTFLESGGAKHPMDLFREFRGREPSSAALLRNKGLLPESQQANNPFAFNVHPKPRLEEVKQVEPPRLAFHVIQ